MRDLIFAYGDSLSKGTSSVESLSDALRTHRQPVRRHTALSNWRSYLNNDFSFEPGYENENPSCNAGRINNCLPGEDIGEVRDRFLGSIQDMGGLSWSGNSIKHPSSYLACR